MNRVAAAMAVLSSLLVGTEARGDEGTCHRPLPDPALATPPGQRLALQLEASGVQVYTCTATPAGAAWVFTAPEAALSGPGGAPAGKHYAGPTWEALDGSRVVGAKVAGAAPDATAIPWLLLRATTTGGAGKLSKVSFIQRVATRGGLAPAGGCDPARLGAVARIAYTATYCFHEPVDAAPPAR
jgi:hypothetical protein